MAIYTHVGLLCIHVAQITVISHGASVSYCRYLNARGDKNGPSCSSPGGHTLAPPPRFFSLPRPTSAVRTEAEM